MCNIMGTVTEAFTTLDTFEGLISARSVGAALAAVLHISYIRESTLERNLMSVMTVGKLFITTRALFDTRGPTQERSHTSATTVGKLSV